MSSQAQQEETMGMPPPVVVTDEHRWLKQLVGTWTYAGDATTPDGGCVSSGTQTIRMLGDVWMLAEGEGPAGGEMMKALITLGYDTDRKKFVGTFIASMMSNLWLYEGALDKDGKTLRLASEGPRFDGKPGMGQYEDVIEIVSKDEYLFRGRFKQDDGTWNEFMVTRYTRTS